ncbi:MAG: DNA repair protein RadC [Chloroflexi bacterium]|nr:DNA repair protein RadC [Chloroflexota bacterium]
MSAIGREAAVPYHHTIKELPSNLRPRERLITDGASHLRDDELIAIVLRTGSGRQNVMELAANLIARFENLEGLSNASLEDLQEFPGVGTVKAVELTAAFELARRLKRVNPNTLEQITSPRQVYDLLAPGMAHSDHEIVRILVLNTKHRVQKTVTLSEGTLNGANVRTAEVFKEAVRLQASAIVMAHNHPSGDPTPSEDDIAVTKKVIAAGDQLDIEVLDHVVIGQPSGNSPGWVSLKERGLGFGRS